jgi:hypothetical protein
MLQNLENQNHINTFGRNFGTANKTMVSRDACVSKEPQQRHLPQAPGGCNIAPKLKSLSLQLYLLSQSAKRSTIKVGTIEQRPPVSAFGGIRG